MFLSWSRRELLESFWREHREAESGLYEYDDLDNDVLQEEENEGLNFSLFLSWSGRELFESFKENIGKQWVVRDDLDNDVLHEEENEGL